MAHFILRYTLLLFLPIFLLNAEKKPKARMVDPDTSLEIITVVDSDMFPEHWLKGDIKANSASLSKKERKRSFEIISRAISKYKPEVIRKNLKRVYIVNTLNFYGMDYGGTYSNQRVFISNKGAEQGYTDDFIERTFHHEFSSVLLENYSRFINREKWSSYNLEEYGEGGVNALREGKTKTHIEEEFCKKGFLSEYSSAAFEEDFNIFAENLFSCNQDFWIAVNKYDRLKKKYALMVNFYTAIHKGMDGKYFQNLYYNNCK